MLILRRLNDNTTGKTMMKMILKYVSSVGYNHSFIYILGLGEPKDYYFIAICQITKQE